MGEQGDAPRPWYVPEDVPEGRCGFTTDYEGPWLPGDVTCWRESWRDHDRCIWHADVADKPTDELILARTGWGERLDRAVLRDAELADTVDFTDSILVGADLSGTEFGRAVFAQADLRGVDFADTDLRESVLVDADLRRGILTNADLRGADLTDANFGDAVLMDVALQYADLTGADLSGVDLTGADLRRTYLTDANLREAALTDAYLREADLTDASLVSADLTDADLRRADLTDADLQDADLTGADLQRAYFTNANLRETNLTNVDLAGADLSGAVLDRGERRSRIWLRKGGLVLFFGAMLGMFTSTIFEENAGLLIGLALILSVVGLAAYAASDVQGFTNTWAVNTPRSTTQRAARPSTRGESRPPEERE